LRETKEKNNEEISLISWAKGRNVNGKLGVKKGPWKEMGSSLVICSPQRFVEVKKEGGRDRLEAT